MSDEAPKAKKKKGKARLLILLVGIIVLVGGGVGAGLYASKAGLLGGAEQAAVDPDRPQLVRKGSGEGEGGDAKAAGKGEVAYESRYFQLEQEFTSNLRDSVHFIQVGIAVSTNYDERVIANMQTHQLAVRSAVLMALSETSEEEVFTTEGKEALQQRLVRSINAVLQEKEGFGGIGNVYFTNFIVQ